MQVTLSLGLQGVAPPCQVMAFSDTAGSETTAFVLESLLPWDLHPCEWQTIGRRINSAVQKGFFGGPLSCAPFTTIYRKPTHLVHSFAFRSFIALD